MKIKLLSTLLLTLALGCFAAFAENEPTPLEKEMKTMNKSLRTLKKQAEDAAKKDENLALIATIKKSVEASAKLEPAETKKVPAAEKAAYLDKYKAQMTDLAKTYDELEAAIKDGKAKVGDGKDVAHKKSLENGGGNGKGNTAVQERTTNRGWRKGSGSYNPDK